MFKDIVSQILLFQSTPSVGRATIYTKIQCHTKQKYFNPRPPWGGRLILLRLHSRGFSNFNPRPPWGGRHGTEAFIPHTEYFNPRPPWGGRPIWPCIAIISRNFNPRPPWGGRRCLLWWCASHSDFNPRPPWGGRRRPPFIFILKSAFQSTPSVGRATLDYTTVKTNFFISIHALRGEGDVHGFTMAGLPCENFNPRPPWGGRPWQSARAGRTGTFQSTPSVGRATRRRTGHRRHCGISIHALRGEGDFQAIDNNVTYDIFQSTPSVGRATV